jgi:serine phosphatase RsbU (regulator of sigma subunit)/anti-sigma regulatory factor (Ser/Thr protein kinase)
MITLRDVWKTLMGRGQREPRLTWTPAADPFLPATSPELHMATGDPLMAYFQSSIGPVDVENLALESPALQTLKEAGVKVVVPLVSQGELIGTINLGPRLSEQEYSADDRKLLNDLAIQAAPAVRVAQLVRQQQAEAQARERLEQELRVARLIQQTLLPKEVPSLPGWQLAAYWQPARAVGGDFYDFLPLPDGRMVLIVADVTDKGVPAALVMATTRAILRGSARRLLSPGAALERTNNLLCPEMPPSMFVTCLYAILDPASGRLHYANAGHDLPYWRHNAEAVEMRATGMPLGLLPDMHYEEKELTLTAGDSVLLYSDGLVEAHNPQRDMFGFPHLRQLVADHPGGAGLIDFLLAELAAFTGPDWEQEDDVTLLTVQRLEEPSPPTPSPLSPLPAREKGIGGEGQSWRHLAEFSLPSQPGNERLAAERVAAAAAELDLPPQRLERLKTAVAEATMNAMEHGNHYQPELPVSIRVLHSAALAALAVRITDQGGGQPIPDPETPDLEAKLAGLQSPRGWGLFLIEKMVDEMHVTSDATHHTIELILYSKGADYGRPTS